MAVIELTRTTNKSLYPNWAPPCRSVAQLPAVGWRLDLDREVRKQNRPPSTTEKPAWIHVSYTDNKPKATESHDSAPDRVGDLE